MAKHNEKNCDCVIGFKAGQSPDGGLGLEREVCPTLSATPSALEPTVCHPANGQLSGGARHD